MFDARHLLGTLLGTGMGGRRERSTFGAGDRSARLGTSAGDSDPGGGLGGLLGRIGGISGGGTGSGLATLGGVAGLLGAGGKFGKAAGLATLGGLALHALRNYQERQGMDPGTVGAAPDAPNETVSDDDALLIIRAMVAAANADGQIDQDEEERILGQLERSAATDEERDFLRRELENPPGLDEIARQVNDRTLAHQIYGASLMAMSADTPAEKSYLRYLADRIGLDRAEVDEIHSQLRVPAP